MLEGVVPVDQGDVARAVARRTVALIGLTAIRNWGRQKQFWNNLGVLRNAFWGCAVILVLASLRQKLLIGLLAVGDRIGQ